MFSDLPVPLFYYGEGHGTVGWDVRMEEHADPWMDDVGILRLEVWREFSRHRQTVAAIEAIAGPRRRLRK